MAIIQQERFQLNSNRVANKFVLAHVEDIPRIKSERNGVEVKVFLDPNGVLYYVPVQEISTVEVLDSHIEQIEEGFIDFDLKI